ncbi:MAG TPA: hypothetical protein VFS21_05490 [Roseiflexaceae bacterium]|nr:hypothetical protein [Roseiflexaceae bacterium]
MDYYDSPGLIAGVENVGAAQMVYSRLLAAESARVPISDEQPAPPLWAVSDPVGAPDEEPWPEVDQVGEPRILVIDWDADFRALAVRLLRWGGYAEVRGIQDAQFPAAVAEYRPQLILLGCYRRHADHSLLMLRQLRAQPSTRGAAVILCVTDPTLGEEMVRSDPLQRCAVIHKPFQIEVFLDLVQAQFERLAPPRPALSASAASKGFP